MIPAVVRWQLVSPSPDAAAAFYEKLFGWSVSRGNALGYRQVDSGAAARGIGGGIWPAPPGAPSFVQLVIEVADVDGAVAAAEKLGGAVLVPKSVLPDGDVVAVLRDPLGVTFGLCSLARR
jgi:hypothetical protein